MYDPFCSERTRKSSAIPERDVGVTGVRRPDQKPDEFSGKRCLTASELEVLRREFPRPLTRDRATGRAIADRRVVHVADLQEDPEFAGAPLRAVGFRSVLAVPMLRDGEPIGVLGLWRREVRPFTEKQITLVSIFADQAVIVIENVRLFTKLQEKNRVLTQTHAQLTEALDQQKVTSEILRVISSAPTDLQPVFDTIVESVVQLCDGVSATVYRFDGHLIHLIAHHHSVTSAAREAFERVYPCRRAGRVSSPRRSSIGPSFMCATSTIRLSLRRAGRWREPSATGASSPCRCCGARSRSEQFPSDVGGHTEGSVRSRTARSGC